MGQQLPMPVVDRVYQNPASIWEGLLWSSEGGRSTAETLGRLGFNSILHHLWDLKHIKTSKSHFSSV